MVALRELVVAVMAGQTIVAKQGRWARKDKTVIFGSISVAPLCDECEAIAQAIALAEDVTARRLAEERVYRQARFGGGAYDAPGETRRGDHPVRRWIRPSQGALFAWDDRLGFVDPADGLYHFNVR